MNYFYHINSDVLNNIIYYLDYEDIEFIINHENLINYHDLFIMKYGKYYNQNIKDFDIKNIYLGFLALEYEVYLEIFLDEIQGTIPQLIKDNIDVNKYLIYNSLLEVNESYIAELDNLDIFLFLEDSLNINYLFKSLLNLKTYKILEYILQDKDYKYFDTFNLIDIIQSYYSDHEMEMKITELIIKYQSYLDEYILFSVYTSNFNIESFIYIIKSNFFKPTETHLTELLNEENKSNNVYIKFKMIIEKYYLNDVFNLYNNYVDKKIIKDPTERLKILTYLSNMNMIINSLEIEDDIAIVRQQSI